MTAPNNALTQCLRRMERLVEALEETRDARARTLARELLDSCLDLHGMALARMLTIAERDADGESLLAKFVSDDLVAAALMLHGLHPEEPETRLRRAIALLRETSAAEIELIEIAQGVARVALRLPEGCDDRVAARREIEVALTDAAPDLERILLEDRASILADPA